MTQAAPRTAPRPAVLAAPVAVGLVVLVLALLVGGGAPEPAPAGLPDAGAGTGWAAPVLRLLQHAAALATAGALLAGLLGATAQRTPPLSPLAVAVPAATWALAASASVVVGLSEVTGRPLGSVLRLDLVRSYAGQVATGRALLVTAALALAVALAAPAVRALWARALLLVVALTALVPPLRTGHAATADDHTLAVTAVSVHVVAVVLWVGGLAALAVLSRSADLPTALPRFSALALLCFVTVAVSGAVGAWTRVPSLEVLLGSAYGAVLLAKSLVLLGLGGLGSWHRRRSLPAVAAGGAGPFARLALAELGLMAAALALGVALTRTPT